MPKGYKFNRMEFAGSLGDLGTLLPIAIAMVLFNGLSPLGVFFSIGIFYVLSGVYFGVTVPVQPMKVIGAYAIATSMSPDQILSSSLLMGVFLLIIGMTGSIDFIQRFTPKAVIRGVQLSTGVLLISGGIKFIIGTSRFQLLQNAVEPYLAYQYVGPLPLSLIIGIISGIITLMLLDSKKFPAGLIIISGGLITGILLGKVDSGNLHMALNLPELFPFGFPDKTDFSFALFALVLPQLPMTLGNAVMAYTDLSKKYFGILSIRVTNQKVCVSMGLANIFSFCLGGMPMCHGAGGLAAHYRFGARTGGSNLMIGFIFIVLAMLLGDNIIQALNLLPMSILGVLLIFAGSQLTLTIMDLSSRKDYYIATLILGITLASNLASGFIAGMLVGYLLRWDKLSV
ncbi:MAG: putative sulfate transporter [Candidatus Magnetoglobus multicellularis str. Araruama]|uniref:Putative sulfate transporter n=1 Tax=Candidatus Magnetoglobus multicellularis str. Araruama TaxID=890399 RepID=A0A1V1PCE4_9BACT|nr:MAG: putative sulfate transporter [Candidatus Magnetoglobus multicellularis str. Araruama]